LFRSLEELIRAIGNRPIIINSGYRCPTHNRNVGGAKNSQHMYGKAADIRAKDMSPRTLEKFADTIFANGGVGMGGATIVHVDTMGNKARGRYNERGDEIVEIYDVPIIPLLVATVELATKLGLPDKLAAVLSAFLGVVIGLVYVAPENPPKAILVGLSIGLAASGLYSGVKNTAEGIKGQ